MGKNKAPILFNTEMVRAILDRRKTVTRRAVKDPYYIDDEQASRVSGLAMHKGTNITHGMPYEDQLFSPGDILWVRETWRLIDFDFIDTDWSASVQYKADMAMGERWHDLSPDERTGWRPSIHMPKEAARIWLRVTEVHVERLRDISLADAAKEGCENLLRFDELWDSTIKPADRDRYGWDANPWVWVIAFERTERPVTPI